MPQDNVLNFFSEIHTIILSINLILLIAASVITIRSIRIFQKSIVADAGILILTALIHLLSLQIFFLLLMFNLYTISPDAAQTVRNSIYYLFLGMLILSTYTISQIYSKKPHHISPVSPMGLSIISLSISLALFILTLFLPDYTILPMQYLAVIISVLCSIYINHVRNRIKGYIHILLNAMLIAVALTGFVYIIRVLVSFSSTPFWLDPFLRTAELLVLIPAVISIIYAQIKIHYHLNTKRLSNLIQSPDTPRPVKNTTQATGSSSKL